MAPFMRITTIACLVTAGLLPSAVAFVSSRPNSASRPSLELSSRKSSCTDSDYLGEVSRRSLVRGTTAAILSTFAASLGTTVCPSPAEAKPDCFTDCIKNCKQIVPNDTSNYCRDSCIEYCAQPDRRDGLSGSVSSEGGETGILGLGTVVKGEDKPPIVNLPGLDFGSKEGKKLIGL